MDAIVDEVLTDALRAPSAHNAQPWRLVATGRPSGFEVHYDHHDYLPFDPDDRDAFLAMGGFVETLGLAARRRGLVADVDPRFERRGSDLWVADVDLRPETALDAPDPLADPAAARHTNRGRYLRRPVPTDLRGALEDLGNVLVEPAAMSRLVVEASVSSWRDRRFVADLDRWTSGDDAAPAGMTPTGLGLSRTEWVALRAAFRLRRLPAPVARLYSSRDSRLLRASAGVCVLGAESLDAVDLFAAGRRLLRSWVTVGAHGWATHPISIAVDRPETAPRVGAMAGLAVPVAVYRIGVPDAGAPRSNRRPLADVLLDADRLTPTVDD
jgi:hypothetical protein